MPKGMGYCVICGSEIRMQIFKGTDVCCEICRKIRDGEEEKNNGK